MKNQQLMGQIASAKVPLSRMISPQLYWVMSDSEFFHGKDWEVLKPQLERGKNAEFWINKISNNQHRDDEVNKQLQFLGWTVIRFWGKDIMKNTDECIRVIEEAIFDEKCNDYDME